MSNFRKPANIIFSSLCREVHFSTIFRDKTGEKLIEHVQGGVDDKINTNKFKYLLPYLDHGNTKLTPTANTANDTKVSEEAEKNINLELLANCPSTAVSNYCDTVGDSKCDSELSSSPSSAPPQSLPVLMVAKVKAPMDLTHVTLPLSLHAKEKNSLLTDAVVQDLKRVYFKTSSAIDGCYLVARTQGRVLYTSMEEIIKRSNLMQTREKNALAVYDPKVLMNLGPVIQQVNEVFKKILNFFKNLLGMDAKKPGGKESKDGKDDKDKKKEETPVKTEKKEGEGK